MPHAIDYYQLWIQPVDITHQIQFDHELLPRIKAAGKCMPTLLSKQSRQLHPDDLAAIQLTLGADDRRLHQSTLEEAPWHAFVD